MQHNFPNRIARIVLRFFRLDGDPENALTGDVCHAHANRELHLPTIHFLASSSLIFFCAAALVDSKHFSLHCIFLFRNSKPGKGFGPEIRSRDEIFLVVFSSFYLIS